MTCIVGVVHKGRVWLGGDSAGVDTDSFALTARADTKVFANGPYIMGFTHSFRMGQLLAYALKPPTPLEGEDLMGFMVTDFVNAVRDCLRAGGVSENKDGVESCGSFLVGFEGRLFHIQGDFQVAESVHGFDACGCGADIALGSLHSTKGMTDPKKRLSAALIAAETFSAGVRSPFHIIGESATVLKFPKAKRG